MLIIILRCKTLKANSFDYNYGGKRFGRNPLHPYISIHILQTVLSSFPVELIRRICLQSRVSKVEFASISCILMTLMFDSGVIPLGEIRCWSLLGIKELDCFSHMSRCALRMGFIVFLSVDIGPLPPIDLLLY